MKPENPPRCPCCRPDPNPLMPVTSWQGLAEHLLMHARVARGQIPVGTSAGPLPELWKSQMGRQLRCWCGKWLNVYPRQACRESPMAKHLKNHMAECYLMGTLGVRDD